VRQRNDSKEDLENMLYHHTENRASSKQRNINSTAPVIPVLEMAQVDTRRAGDTWKASEELHPKG
jgi:hypothetical protein